MKINITPRIKTLDPRLYELLRELAIQVNGLSEGKLVATYNAYTAAPTTGTWAQGDFVRNSNPTEQNTGGLKYVLYGWECVASGTPGTWVECRFQTGGGVEVTKLLTATATLDFPSLSSNETEELTMTVTGAEAGDTVILAPPAALERDLVFSGFVLSADTVSIRLHNCNHGAINPASATWRATVMKIE